MAEVEFRGGSFMKFVVAGAIAGTAEHTGMFPLDTVKVTFQTLLGVCLWVDWSGMAPRRRVGGIEHFVRALPA
jgi:hypothetical protein